MPFRRAFLAGLAAAYRLFERRLQNLVMNCNPAPSIPRGIFHCRLIYVLPVVTKHNQVSGDTQVYFDQEGLDLEFAGLVFRGRRTVWRIELDLAGY